MNQILEAISRHAKNTPGNIALHSRESEILYADLQKQIWKIATVFIENEVRVLGLYLENSIEWVLIDLAAQCAGVTLVPLPFFFSKNQIEFIFEKANIDSVISDNSEFLPYSYKITIIRKLESGINLYKRKKCSSNYSSLKHTGKITFTSGTSGQPKGVCLTNNSIASIAASLVAVTKFIQIKKHLCLLPLSTLLENIAGVYAPLLKGITCQLPSLKETGLSGATGFEASRMFDCINKYQPNSMILLPQMLQGLMCGLEAGSSIPDSLKFIAVGGGMISMSLIKRARAKKIPVYEGYGLSECASVVTLNVPDNDRPGSAGKILNNIEVHLSDDNEILLKGNFMQGYLGGKAISNDEWFATGDVGKIDEKGFVYITGRKKNIFITSFGRNVSPEWTESELICSPLIKQAAVFGEARPANCAIIVPVDIHTYDCLIENAIDMANKNLPDYARIHYWIRAKEEFNLKNGLGTANGRPVRDKLYKLYESDINNCYEKKLSFGNG